VEEAGAFAAVVESVPADIGAKLTAAVAIPTIGIGAGASCDGQVLVFHDMLGLFPDFKPKFAKRYADLGAAAKAAVETYCREVRDGSFPAAEHTFR
jgi:3-methyl-2-oxobutanoate hydroxymethyltransferase